MGRAKSYAERLFDFPEVGPLSPEAASVAITKPARELGVEFRSFDLTQTERRYLQTMAELGAGPHRSGEIACELGLRLR